jgi:hypothetical protein
MDIGGSQWNSAAAMPGFWEKISCKGFRICLLLPTERKLSSLWSRLDFSMKTKKITKWFVIWIRIWFDEGLRRSAHLYMTMGYQKALRNGRAFLFPAEG